MIHLIHNPKLTSNPSSTLLSLHLRQRNQLSPKKPSILNLPKPLHPFTTKPISLTHFPIHTSLNKHFQISQDDQTHKPKETFIEKKHNKSFWAAVTLIIGTAVGPGMLGLPSATIRAGLLPSTLAIILSWAYVISSILLVAELSFAVMKQSNVEEVSFTSLATEVFFPSFGTFVAVIYACLSFSLIIACVSGIGSLVMQQFPLINPLLAHSIFPAFIGIIIGFFPFKAIDTTNRLLCFLMLFSITSLVLIGFSVGRNSLLGSLSLASWKFPSVMPAIPVTVLTLGFHVITPFVCRIVGNSHDVRRAILFGGAVPLFMVLSWNAVILGLVGGGRIGFKNPIELLLSVNSSALPAVQGFAFAALATSLIGYAVSFPKQLVDTVKLIGERIHGNGMEGLGKDGMTDGLISSDADSSWNGSVVTWLVLIAPIFIASFFQTAFTKALDFAGVYANCFLFGILPPAMAWIHRSKRGNRSSNSREDLLPGGNVVLVILFAIAVVLGFWH